MHEAITSKNSEKALPYEFYWIFFLPNDRKLKKKTQKNLFRAAYYYYIFF